MVWALILTFLLASTPAYAADDIEVVSVPDVEVPETVDETKKEVIEDAKEEKTIEPVATEEPKQEPDTKAKEAVEEEREELSMEDDPTKVEYAEPIGGTKAPISITAWTNSNPTSQYAHYAEGLLSEVPYGGHYVFVQDTQQSYVFAVGEGDSISSLTNGKWWRWYNVQGRGYILERGSGNISVSAGDYTVLSDFSEWPSLVEETGEVTRREIMLYACAAAVGALLARIWSFCLRWATVSSER